MWTYTIKTWTSEHGQPTIQTGLNWPAAWLIATKLGYAKVQVISEEFGTIELETKN